MAQATVTLVKLGDPILAGNGAIRLESEAVLAAVGKASARGIVLQQTKEEFAIVTETGIVPVVVSSYVQRGSVNEQEADSIALAASESESAKAKRDAKAAQALEDARMSGVRTAAYLMQNGALPKTPARS